MSRRSDSVWIGKAIRERRIELGLSQQKLAQKANLSLTVIGRLERGGTIPSPRTRYRMSEALEWIEDWFEKLSSKEWIDQVERDARIASGKNIWAKHEIAVHCEDEYDGFSRLYCLEDKSDVSRPCYDQNNPLLCRLEEAGIFYKPGTLEYVEIGIEHVEWHQYSDGTESMRITPSVATIITDGQ